MKVTYNGTERKVEVVETARRIGEPKPTRPTYQVQVTFEQYGFKENGDPHRSMAESYVVIQGLTYKKAREVAANVTAVCDSTYGQGYSAARKQFR